MDIAAERAILAAASIPWEAREWKGRADGAIVDVHGYYRAEVRPLFTETTTALIVRAVNSHEAFLGLMEAVGPDPDAMNSDGMVAALWWALDELDVAEKRLVETGHDADRIWSALQRAAHERARRALANGRAALDAVTATLGDEG